jgi:hypothetical protein
MRHFFAASQYGYNYGDKISRILGYGNEWAQWWGGSSSAFSPEDLPSNKAGALFGDHVIDDNDDKTLRDELEEYFETIGALPKDKAPTIDLPAAPKGQSNSSSEPEKDDACDDSSNSSGSSEQNDGGGSSSNFGSS